MKLLFLTPQLPYPPHQGTTIRNFHLLAGLAQHHDIALLSFADRKRPLDETPLPDLCYRVDTVSTPPARSIPQRLLKTFLSTRPDMALRLPSRDFQARLEQLVHTEHFDVVQIEGIEMGQYGLNLRRRRLLTDRMKLVFDDHNAEYVLQQRAFLTDVRQPARWPAAGYSLIQWVKLRRYEREVCRLADRVVAVSETDARALRRLVPGLSPAVVPNGVDVNTFRVDVNTFHPDSVRSDSVRSDSVEHGGVQPASLTFTGKMDFRPNIDAMVWFCNETLPRIQAARSGVTLAIVGREPHARVRALADRRGITVTGYVDDVRPYVAGAQVYIVPLRMGGGTRLKVLQAMAMGKAIVSTTLGAEGIAGRSGEHLALADTPEDFAIAVLSLLADPGRRAALGARARRLVEREYTWEAIVPCMDHVYTK
ncbi:MAG: D-inositol-3-phosphate glycosyltransferase [Anaerolineales bacterium]|nr:D-inositol-3-phosphate glycosyltransferase [Anaerolineales bacterium]